MSPMRVFLDTSFIQALIDRGDQFHARARSLRPILAAAAEVWTTEAVLIEVGNALGARLRAGAAAFIRGVYSTANARVVPVDSALLQRSLGLYEARPDKEWGLTDCISFTVMREDGLADALTADQRFVQAGFRALMREDS